MSADRGQSSHGTVALFFRSSVNNIFPIPICNNVNADSDNQNISTQQLLAMTYPRGLCMVMEHQFCCNQDYRRLWRKSNWR
tara:strand:+ start:213 stop:455 length:243 start_codon:yes stop_codon:yes gene_type:complete